MFDDIPNVNRAIASCKCASFADKLDGLKLGVNKNVGDIGGALSSGRRQRVLLARDFYRRPSFFILDEATANMDEENEKNVLSALKYTRSTILFATHSKRVMAAADRIICVD